jgi:hypothetical protein
MSACDFSFKIFDQNIYYIDVEVIHIKKIKLSDSQLIKNIFKTVKARSHKNLPFFIILKFWRIWLMA